MILMLFACVSSGNVNKNITECANNRKKKEEREKEKKQCHKYGDDAD